MIVKKLNMISNLKLLVDDNQRYGLLGASENTCVDTCPSGFINFLYLNIYIFFSRNLFKNRS